MIPAEELKARTKIFAVRVVHLFRALPKSEEGRVIGRQLLRSASPVAANYRAVCRARSRAEFAAKMGVVVEEADETVFWLEFVVDAGLMPEKRLQPLITDANELLAIFAASQRTVRKR